ncbi:MAG TPA: hypothetical protein VF374_05200 [Thermoplasmata archaeon]|jgi:hypothetical protein
MYKSFGTPVSASGTEGFEYAGEMIANTACSSPGPYYIGAGWMDPTPRSDQSTQGRSRKTVARSV